MRESEAIMGHSLPETGHLETGIRQDNFFFNLLKSFQLVNSNQINKGDIWFGYYVLSFSFVHYLK